MTWLMGTHKTLLAMVRSLGPSSNIGNLRNSASWLIVPALSMTAGAMNSQPCGAIALCRQSPVGWLWISVTACANDRLYERSEEHTSELQSLMRTSYAAFCLTKKKK